MSPTVILQYEMHCPLKTAFICELKMLSMPMCIQTMKQFQQKASCYVKPRCMTGLEKHIGGVRR